MEPHYRLETDMVMPFGTSPDELISKIDGMIHRKHILDVKVSRMYTTMATAVIFIKVFGSNELNGLYQWDEISVRLLSDSPSYHPRSVDHFTEAIRRYYGIESRRTITSIVKSSPRINSNHMADEIMLFIYSRKIDIRRKLFTQYGEDYEVTADQIIELIISRYNKTVFAYEGMNHDVTITSIQFERETGNTNRNTFDFIRVECGVTQAAYRKSTLKEWYLKNKTELMKLVVDAVKKKLETKKFSVPINFLHISEVTLTRDSMVVFVFELKNIKEDK